MKWVVVLDMVIVVYCEDNLFIYGGVVYDGIFVEKEGLKGILNIVEFV